MNSLEIVAFIFGGLLLLVGILGGGFELKELKVPKVGRGSRIIASIAGVIFIIVGLGLGENKKMPSGDSDPGKQLTNNADLQQESAPVEFTISDQLTEGAISERLTIIIDGKNIGTLSASQQYPTSMLKVTVPMRGRCSYTVDGGISYFYRERMIELPCMGQGMIDVESGKKFDLGSSISGNTCTITILEAKYE